MSNKDSATTALEIVYIILSNWPDKYDVAVYIHIYILYIYTYVRIHMCFADPKHSSLKLIKIILVI